MDSEERGDWFLGFWLIFGIVSLLILLFGGFILIYSWLNPGTEVDGWWVFLPLLEVLGWIGIGFLESCGKTCKDFKKNIPGPDKPS